MKVIALKEGYFGKLRMPGDEFDVPEGSKASWFAPVQTAVSALPVRQGSHVPDGLSAFLLPGSGAPQDDPGGGVPPLQAESPQAPAEASQVPTETPSSPALPETTKAVSEFTKVVSDTAPSGEQPADDAPSASQDHAAAEDQAKDADAKPAAKPAAKRTRAAAPASGGDAA